MPKYIYKCGDCDNLFVYHHSISDIKTNCEGCGVVDSLIRQPSKFSINREVEVEKKTGQVVKKAIEDFRTDLEQEKNKLKDFIWSPND